MNLFVNATHPKSIITFQPHSLKWVASKVASKVACEVFPQSSRSCGYWDLHSSLTELLKQPQFRSLSLDWYPVPEAYELIETFLCTPATPALTFGDVDEMDAHDEEEGSGGSEEKEVRGRMEIIITTEMQEMVGGRHVQIKRQNKSKEDIFYPNLFLRPMLSLNALN